MSPESLAGLSNDLVTAAIVVYALAMVAFAAEAAFGWRVRPAAVAAASGALAPGSVAAATLPRGEPGPASGLPARAGRVGVALTVLAFALHLAAVLTRGLAAGRAPWGNMYEFALTSALAAAGAFLVLLRRYDVRVVGVVVVPAVLLTLGLAVTVLYTESAELVPALKSIWLVVHVLAAIVSAGALTVGAGLCALLLLRERAARRAEARASPVSGWAGRLPEVAVLDRVAGRVHAFTFPLWTFAVIAGAIWAENAWGRYWGWDPKETWAFVTWVLYAAYLHARATAGWRGGRAAWIALGGYTALLFNFVGVNLWITGLHSYAGVS